MTYAKVPLVTIPNLIEISPGSEEEDGQSHEHINF